MTNKEDLEKKASAAKVLEAKEKRLEKKVEKKEEKLEKEIQKTIRIQNKLLKEAQDFRSQFSERLLKLVTSGFGFVSALAWNELIREFVKSKIKPFFGEESGLISLLIYAVIVTFLAVLVTYQLSKIGEKK